MQGALRDAFSGYGSPCVAAVDGEEVDTGVIYHYDELDTEWLDNDLELGDAKAEAAYKFGGKHTPLTHLLRGILWRKRFWCTEKLNNWLDNFKPECVFLAFSDDYFIPQIAMYVAKRYNVPIVSCIGDDYYFNVEKTLNPIYHLYKSTYKKLIDKVLAWPGSAIYISDKIRDKYNSEFGLDGETVYLTSTVQRKPFSVINKDCPVITYFGNIGMGRNNSLNDIATPLEKSIQNICWRFIPTKRTSRSILYSRTIKMSNIWVLCRTRRFKSAWQKAT